MTDSVTDAPERETIIKLIQDSENDWGRIRDYGELADAILAAGYTRPSLRAPSGWRASDVVAIARSKVDLASAEWAHGGQSDAEEVQLNQSLDAALDALCAAVWRSAQQ